jgi:hypothetical protein
MKCTTCGNLMGRRKVRRKETGPFCRPLYRTEKYCSYCEWKGTSGTGKLLRAIIKEINHDRV